MLIEKKTVKQTGISFAGAVAFHLFIIAFFLSFKKETLQMHKLIYLSFSVRQNDGFSSNRVTLIDARLIGIAER